MALHAVVPDRIWTVERPVWFGGVRLRATTTVVRLDDGSLLLHSPAPPTDEWTANLAGLGPVRWLVVPNCFHHLGAPTAAARFRGARVVGPESARSRNAALKIDIDIHDAPFCEQVPEFEPLPLLGVPFLDETVLYHRPTQTLIGADIVLCAGAKDHWSWRWAARITGCYERVRVPPDVRKAISDTTAAARSIRAMRDRPTQRLIVSHADVIGEGCLDLLGQAWRREGVDV
jgi:hypothetical protein